jgi:hypothetical protein
MVWFLSLHAVARFLEVLRVLTQMTSILILSLLNEVGTSPLLPKFDLAIQPCHFEMGLLTLKALVQSVLPLWLS